MVPEHLGALHPFEQVLVYLLAFGPFVVLAVVIAVKRRHQPDGETGHDEDWSR